MIIALYKKREIIAFTRANYCGFVSRLTKIGIIKVACVYSRSRKALPFYTEHGSKWKSKDYLQNLWKGTIYS